MRTVVFGTGALGALVGARLARAGRTEVTLAGTWPAALAAVGAAGLVVREDGASWTVPVAVARREAVVGPAELVVVLVKSTQTAAVAADVARVVAPEGCVLTLQNGLGNREVLAEAVGAARVIVGVTSMGALIEGPGRVRATGSGLTVLGGGGPLAGMVEEVAEMFRDAGMEAEVTLDIERFVWRKLAVNCAINPLSAVLGLPNGALLESPDSRERLVAAAREVGAVAAAKGIELGADPVELAIEVARRTAANRSSMLQDLDRGRPTEIEAISGALVREARRSGVAVPVNEALFAQVREREGGAALSERAGLVVGGWV
jgi:2-dehydropantoate 2-reductase